MPPLPSSPPPFSPVLSYLHPTAAVVTIRPATRGLVLKRRGALAAALGSPCTASVRAESLFWSLHTAVLAIPAGLGVAHAALVQTVAMIGARGARRARGGGRERHRGEESNNDKHQKLIAFVRAGRAVK